MTIRKRVELQLKRINQTKTWLAAELRVEKQNLNNWLSRNKIPEGHLFTAAKLLQCDAEWLATGATQSNQVTEPKASYDLDSALEKEIRNLSPDDTEKVASFIAGLKAGRS